MSGHHSVIAVVDDEESVRKALVRFFKAANIDAKAFCSAREFIDSLTNFHFDCLVLDLQMPDMSGIDLQRYLRMVRPDLVLPVIIITAHDEPGMRERCLTAGVAAYMRKPMEGSALLSEIEKLVGGAPVSD